MSVRSFFHFITLIISLSPLYAIAGQARAVISPGVRFDQYFSNHGLPDNRVRNLYQDSKGYLWVGTMNGLCRFDGYVFKKFYSNKAPESITATWAYAIAEDDNSDLYIGTRYGLSKFIRNSESFVSLGKENGAGGHLDGPVSALLLKNKKLWIGTPKGLLQFDPSTGKSRRFAAQPLNLGISKIIPSRGDYLWLGTEEGIVRFNTTTSRFQFFKINIRPNPYGDRIWSLLEDNETLYIGTGGDGLLKLRFDVGGGNGFDFEKIKISTSSGRSLGGTQVFDVVKSARGDLWLATEEGLGRIKYIERELVLEYFTNNSLDKNSISNNIIYKLLIDRNGILWCGTELGLNKSDLSLLAFQYFTFNGIGSADMVRSIASADGTNIFLGTASSGLFKYNTNTGTSSTLRYGAGKLPFNAFRSLYINGGALWAGTLGGAFSISTSDIAAPSSLVNDHATFATLRDSKGNFWIGTNRGLYKLDPQGKQVDLGASRDVPQIVKTGFVRQIYEDKKGDIWLGFENGGLMVIHSGSGKFVKFGDGAARKRLLGTNILAITEYPANVIWVGTEAGLNKISFSGRNREVFTIRIFNEEDGLPDKSINGILASDKGLLWISTIKGLARLDVKKNSFQTYLSNVNFSIGSCYKVSSSKLLFGTSNGFIAFNPQEIPAGGDGPVAAISELKLFNQPVEIGKMFNDDVILHKGLSSTEEIELNYRNNVFTIGFTALHYSNPEENTYSYKMEGFDDHWISADASTRAATYTNLDPGTYFFKVRAANYMNNWSRKPAVLKVTILPPPWKTWWAILLYVVLFNVLLLVLIRYVLIQSRQRQEIEYQKVEKEQLKRLNEMKVNFFTNVSHEFRTPLTLISGPVEELMRAPGIGSEERSKVSFIYRNCKKLLQLLDELMTFQKAEQGMLKLKLAPMNISSFLQTIYTNFQPLAERNKVSFGFDNTFGDRIVSFDPDKLEMVLNNLISNALKFTPQGGEVNLIVAEEFVTGEPSVQYLSIIVEDNGKGISTDELPYVFDRFFSEHNQKGTGVGLALSKTLVELHKGSIDAESTPGKKTIFRVRLPVNEQTALQATPIDYLPGSNVYTEEQNHVSDDTDMTERPLEHKILIVDDNKEILDYLQLMFTGRYRITRAINGKDALDKLKEEEPNLIVSDLMMPLMDGNELCSLIKSDVKTSHIPFILLTAKATDEDKLKGLHTGADDYIPKPFHPEILKVRVEKMIEANKRIIEKYKGDGVIIPKDIAKNPLDEQFLKKVLDTINQNMSNDDFSVEDLGEAVFMSRSHLFRKLKALTGQTPIELIYQVRIKRSMELLLARKLSISEIAYEVGFKNPSSFTSSFKKQYGKSPKEYLGDILKGQKDA
ncbi:hybrid sensor histidine kinase/response regulator transcription factor [Desertivirga xinjiangensis]|uniref:hybrid sensor histidine kinase/response regulator transcription factor n=1 Tax=Desertivirga xinjiangensis TaxID=539206 RepID=UPI00210A46C8|nr:two-component regulator propeller domain-containing protein [Pedobacter xinjiangensis]